MRFRFEQSHLLKNAGVGDIQSNWKFLLIIITDSEPIGKFSFRGVDVNEKTDFARQIFKFRLIFNVLGFVFPF